MQNPVDRAIKVMMLGAGVVSIILFLFFELL